jgi:hypothetical protein
MPSDGVAAMKRSWLHEEIRRLVAELAPVDTVEEEHRRRVLAWLEGTRDVFRRVRPCTPSPHLVSYFLLTAYRRETPVRDHHPDRPGGGPAH